MHEAGQPTRPLHAAKLYAALNRKQLLWRRHALERMLSRGISRQGVLAVLEANDQIETYPNDLPFSSALFLGKVQDRWIHVVAALDEEREELHVISAYEPDEDHFESDMRTRKRG